MTCGVTIHIRCWPWSLQPFTCAGSAWQKIVDGVVCSRPRALPDQHLLNLGEALSCCVPQEQPAGSMCVLCIISIGII